MYGTWNFCSAGQIVFGNGARGRLEELLGRRGIENVLIVTDAVLVEAGVVGKVVDPMSKLNVEIFDGGQPEPSLAVAGQAIAAAQRINPQAIIGLGGGSNLDVAKTAAAVLTHGGTVQDYFGSDKVPGPVLPLVCIPTTSGTGSEVTGSIVLTDEENQVKVAGLSDFLRPTLALVDPELTVTCPAKVTADSGIDALTHAIEAYTAVDYRSLDGRIPPGESSPFDGSHPLGDCLAEKAIGLIGENLVVAVNDPENIEAREAMALAATLAGMAFSSCGVALVHALEYPLGGALHVSHGAGNGLLLPYVMDFNLNACPERFARIAELLGEPVSGLSQDQAAARAVDAVRTLRQEIGVPDRLREIGATPEMLPALAEKSFGIKRLLRVNPREVSQSDILQILQQAL